MFVDSLLWRTFRVSRSVVQMRSAANTGEVQNLAPSADMQWLWKSDHWVWKTREIVKPSPRNTLMHLNINPRKHIQSILHCDKDWIKPRPVWSVKTQNFTENLMFKWKKSCYTLAIFMCRQPHVYELKHLRVCLCIWLDWLYLTPWWKLAIIKAFYYTVDSESLGFFFVDCKKKK